MGGCAAQRRRAAECAPVPVWPPSNPRLRVRVAGCERPPAARLSNPQGLTAPSSRESTLEGALCTLVTTPLSGGSLPVGGLLLRCSSSAKVGTRSALPE